MVPDLNNVNAFTADDLSSGIVAAFAPWYSSGPLLWGPPSGTRIPLKAARDAQRHVPELRTVDRIGNEIYDVEVHLAYLELMSLAFGSGVHALAWDK